MEQVNNIVELPIITIEDNEFILHNYITTVNNKVVLDRAKAALLYIELHKFLNNGNKET